MPPRKKKRHSGPTDDDGLPLDPEAVDEPVDKAEAVAQRYDEDYDDEGLPPALDFG